MHNLTVRTNILSMNSHRNMKNTGIAQARASRQLSSGYRITSAADDSAGLAISESMRAQIRGLNQGSRNAHDGQALLQTADGVLQEVHAMLQRMRELAVQAGNDTYTDINRKYIQFEVTQLTKEIDRMLAAAEFNGIPLFDGSHMNNFEWYNGIRIPLIVRHPAVITAGHEFTPFRIPVGPPPGLVAGYFDPATGIFTRPGTAAPTPPGAPPPPASYLPSMGNNLPRQGYFAISINCHIYGNFNVVLDFAVHNPAGSMTLSDFENFFTNGFIQLSNRLLPSGSSPIVSAVQVNPGTGAIELVFPPGGSMELGGANSWVLVGAGPDAAPVEVTPPGQPNRPGMSQADQLANLNNTTRTYPPGLTTITSTTPSANSAILGANRATSVAENASQRSTGFHIDDWLALRGLPPLEQIYPNDPNAAAKKAANNAALALLQQEFLTCTDFFDLMLLHANWNNTTTSITQWEWYLNPAGNWVTRQVAVVGNFPPYNQTLLQLSQDPRPGPPQPDGTPWPGATTLAEANVIFNRERPTPLTSANISFSPLAVDRNGNVHIAHSTTSGHPFTPTTPPPQGSPVRWFQNPGVTNTGNFHNPNTSPIARTPIISSYPINVSTAIGEFTVRINGVPGPAPNHREVVINFPHPGITTNADLINYLNNALNQPPPTPPPMFPPNDDLLSGLPATDARAAYDPAYPVVRVSIDPATNQLRIVPSERNMTIELWESKSDRPMFVNPPTIQRGENRDLPPNAMLVRSSAGNHGPIVIESRPFSSIDEFIRENEDQFLRHGLILGQSGGRLVITTVLAGERITLARPSAVSFSPMPPNPAEFWEWIGFGSGQNRYQDGWDEDLPPKGLWLQTGANARQGMFAFLSRLNAQDLGIMLPPWYKENPGLYNGISQELGVRQFVPDGDIPIEGGVFGSSVNLGSARHATNAIHIFENAINIVSTERAIFGSQINRLDHAIHSVEISAENLSDAESRIRNTDMARAMMDFTLMNILFQAATSMMSQANQLPNSVLQLLR